MAMRLAILDQDDKVVKVADITNAMDLLTLADQARNVIRECEQLAREKHPKYSTATQGKAPYMT
jgi:hypothetical protein